MYATTVIEANEDALFYTGLITLITVSYLLYLRKFKFYIYHQVDDITEEKANKPRGKCPPFFPNGWYSILNGDELKPRQVRFIDYCGREIVVFRGTNGIVYALDAYCSHMGANLGKGGVVKNGQCIQCPFHGWVFDGETGACVQSFESKANKPVNQFEYHDIDKQVKIDGDYLHKCYEGNIKLKKYHIREINNSILIWFDSRPEFQEEIPYEPLTIEELKSLSPRGESINYVNCHCMEIPENGADIRHFDFLHTSVLDWTRFIKFEWLMKSVRAADETLLTQMKHKKPYFNDFKMKMLQKYITEENKQFLNIIYLDCYLCIFGFRFFVFNLTGFQCGPALVYLFLKFHYFESAFCQAVTPMRRFKQKISHKIYSSGFLPYWLTSYFLYGEVKQLFSDMNIWNNKNFGSRLNYNLKTDTDKNLLSWRNWFSQFFEGCNEMQIANNKLDW